MPPHIAIGLTEQILGALGYAHRQGIVHRDVKPQNVILDPEGQAKVADFGIARAGNSEMTQAGAIIGTVQYLSPEQANGYPVDRRSDLYSAGIVLYELLTGHVPFDGEAPISIALKHVNELPGPAGPAAPGHPAGARGGGPARAREGPEPALPERRGVHRRARAGAPRAHGRRRSWSASSSRSSNPSPRAGGCGRSWRSSVAALAVGAYFLLAGNRVTVPNLVGRDAAEVADILQERGLEPDFEDVVNEDVKRDEVISQNPEAGSEVREGTVVEVRVSAGPGTTAVPDVVGGEEEAAVQALEDAGFKTKVERAYSDTRARGHRHQHVACRPAGRPPRDGRSRSRSAAGRSSSPSPAWSATPSAGANDVLEGRRAGLQDHRAGELGGARDRARAEPGGGREPPTGRHGQPRRGQGASHRFPT